MALRRHLRVLDPPGEAPGAEAAPRVAFATSDRRVVDQHFGAAAGFVVYAVGAQAVHLAAVVQCDPPSAGGNEDKLAERIAALAGCAAVYTNAVGASAIAQLKAAGVEPVKVSPGALIADLLDSVRREVSEAPSGRLARALARRRGRDPQRFARMEAEGWDE